MQRSISTASLNGTLPEKLKAAAAAHFDGVEIFDSDLLYFDGTPRLLRQIADDHGLSVMLFQPFRDFEGAPRPLMAKNFDRAERKFDLMAELGAPLMLVVSNMMPESSTDDTLIAEDLAALAERAALRGLSIGYEAPSWAHHVQSWRHARKLVEQIDLPNFGLVLDSFNVMTERQGWVGLETLPSQRISFIQISDAPKLALPPMEQSRHFRCFPGQGDLDLPRFLAPLLANGYAGPISLEVFNDGFRTASPRTIAADGMRSLLYLEEKTSEILADSEQKRTLDLFSPPASCDYHGFEFLEFACDENGRVKLSVWLEQLGFQLVGKHRTKNVSLYQQGGINLILNAEPHSFAHAFFLLHGASVCNIALNVDDADRAIKRARAYHTPPFSGGIGPKESRIPAICAPDGSLVSFVTDKDGIYQTDFLPVDGPAAPTPDLERIDHVSLGLPEGQFNNWLLFFKAVLDFSADDTWDVPDPYGIVRSRAVRSAGGHVRLPLNISIGPNTATAQSLSSYGGAGVQHIAFSTSDIFATVQAMRSRGIAILEIPQNYYAELSGRFSLSDDFVFSLSENNILYDCDKNGGEFLQAYTESFEGRFVFEIVQRNNYEQYGAANAAVRLAAQLKAAGRSPFIYEALEN
ncbi:TIM barrel protein [Telmatospirillum sp.]|uniref:bifunctional sugar phosphate isomerase/epimerase/4-hydroxyphenylpyruvate dioxygenase family protein n=1 Tax=Telmatospirillum sp. TaxID=2079197 RepID=UPI00283CAD57|nr:TIM barrel protein [Telmatospirillum sp.]MDR3438161.1 TIM barrel protein [Telmatospirillum sp.]